MKINPNIFDYIMYVDASGDDGFNFDNGSTTCYAASSFLVKQEDVVYNLNILSQIKNIVGCKQTDEVKYSKLRRHRRAKDAFPLLSDLKGEVASYVVFKKEVDQAQYRGNKNMSVVCHYMALRTLEKYDFPAGSRVLIAIDHMKHTEEVPLNYVIGANTSKNVSSNIDLSVVFKDSKDADFLLIQIADLLCGITREHFEQYETNPDMLYFASKCPPCQTVFEVKKKFTHISCKNGAAASHRIFSSSNLKHIYSLFPETTGPALFNCFFTEPSWMMRKHFYMACIRKK